MTKKIELDIRPLLAMPVEIPTRCEAIVRKQGVYARLGLGWVKKEFCFPILFQHCIVVLHSNGVVRTAIQREANPKNNKVADINCGA